MKLTAVRAEHGDALVLSAGGRQVLIDGGPSGTYKRHLKRVLKQLPSNVIDLAMVSHIDADHIVGLIDLMVELQDAKEDGVVPFLTVREFWHNSYSDLIIDSDDEHEGQVAAPASLAANMLSGSGGGDSGLSRIVLSSVSQGRQLRHIVEACQVDLNRGFKNSLVMREDQPVVKTIGDLKLTVLGPTISELDKLRNKWQKYLQKLKQKQADVASVSLDRSVSNIASKVVIAEHDGKTVLLTGDARGDMIIKWLEQTQLLQADKTIEFDIVKLPHHGSRRNLSPEFFNRIHAKNYLISGDGGSGNPEPGVFEWLFTQRPELNYKVYLTYSDLEISQHGAYTKRSYDRELAEVLNKEKRRSVVKFPEPGAHFIDIDI